MLEVSHTPGPWRAGETWRPAIGHADHGDRDANGNIFWGYAIYGRSEDGAEILPTLAAVHNFPDNIHANAALIASAPELLDALVRLVAIIDAAGLENLTRGVQLGQISWSVKATGRLEYARAIIANATEPTPPPSGGAS